MDETKPRTYSMTFEDGKKVEKTAEAMTDEQIYACEKLAALNNEINRLNASLNDNIVLKAHYEPIAMGAFTEEIEEKKGE